MVSELAAGEGQFYAASTHPLSNNTQPLAGFDTKPVDRRPRKGLPVMIRREGICLGVGEDIIEGDTGYTKDVNGKEAVCWTARGITQRQIRVERQDPKCSACGSAEHMLLGRSHATPGTPTCLSGTSVPN